MWVSETSKLDRLLRKSVLFLIWKETSVESQNYFEFGKKRFNFRLVTKWG